MIIGRITSKAQTTIPRAVREALGVGAGDEIAYEIKDGVVTIRAMTEIEEAQENPFALFTEWATEADCKAFDDL